MFRNGESFAQIDTRNSKQDVLSKNQNNHCTLKLANI